METNNLMEQILSKENLNQAYLQVVRNKGAEGVDGLQEEQGTQKDTQEYAELAICVKR